MHDVLRRNPDAAEAALSFAAGILPSTNATVIVATIPMRYPYNAICVSQLDFHPAGVVQSGLEFWSRGRFLQPVRSSIFLSQCSERTADEQLNLIDQLRDDASQMEPEFRLATTACLGFAIFALRELIGVRGLRAALFPDDETSVALVLHSMARRQVTFVFSADMRAVAVTKIDEAMTRSESRYSLIEPQSLLDSISWLSPTR